MRQRNYRNFACVIGLAVGLSLIGLGSSASAAEYVRDENGEIQYAEDGLPIILETKTITATRTPSVMDRIRQLGVPNFVFDDDKGDESIDAEIAVLESDVGV